MALRDLSPEAREFLDSRVPEGPLTPEAIDKLRLLVQASRLRQSAVEAKRRAENEVD